MAYERGWINMNTPIFKSLTNQHILLGCTFWWVVGELLFVVILALYSDLFILFPFLIIGLHIFGIIQTRKDPNFLLVWKVYISKFAHPIKRDFLP